MAKKAFKYNSETLLREMVTEANAIDPATEAVSKTLNEVIAKHKLSGQSLLKLMARLSAESIHRVQYDLCTPETRDKAEEYFQDYLAGRLGLHEYVAMQHDLSLN